LPTNHNRQEKPSAWRESAIGRLDVQVIAGNHYTIVRGPNVEILGRQLNDRLGRIETD
jgi:thioesterase domain-containing protein